MSGLEFFQVIQVERYLFLNTFAEELQLVILSVKIWNEVMISLVHQIIRSQEIFLSHLKVFAWCFCTERELLKRS